jgi:large subunit ribosomal protein L21
MYAVIRTGGKQYRVQVGDVLDVEKLDVEEGKKVTFGEVLLIEDNGNTLIGTPTLDKAQVVGEVIENFKDKKVIVFKKKRRKQYRRMKGHRQLLTRVKIESIIPEGGAPQREKPVEKKVELKEEPKIPITEVTEKKSLAKEEKPKTKKAEKQVKKKEAPEVKPKAPKAAVSARKATEKKQIAKKIQTGKKKITSKKEK